MSPAVSRSSFAATTLALVLALPATGLAANTSSTPTFPTPASAKVPPTATAASAPATTVTTTTTVAPAATATTPTSPSTTLSSPGAAVNPLDRAAVNARLRATRAHSSGSGQVSTEAIVLAAIAALLLLACAAWAFARSRAYEPHWLVSLRHAMAEAGFRTSATWAEFTDWARLGR
jgi:hypothetical protein